MLEVEAARQKVMIEDLLEKDRAVNSATAGKAFLVERLRQNLPFMLVLRSFELESRLVEEPAAGSRELHPIEGARTVVMAGARPLNDALLQVSADCPPLMIVNPDDIFTYTAAAKIHADPADWRRLVFSLCAEAAVVVVALSAGQDPTRGVAEELVALKHVGAASRTIVVLQPRLSGFAEGLPPNRENAAALHRTLLANGLTVFIDEAELEVLPDALSRAAQAMREAAAP